MDSLFDLFENFNFFFDIGSPSDGLQELINLDDFKSAVVMLHQSTRTFDPIAAICIQNCHAINKLFVDTRFMNVPTDDAVEPSSMRLSCQCLFESTHECAGTLDSFLDDS